MANEINRIEKKFIIQNIEEKDLPVSIHANKKEILAFIESMEKEQLRLKANPGEWDDLHQGQKVQVFFSYFTHVMTFQTSVREVNGRSCTVDFPEGMYKNLQRKYERIETPDNISITFTYKGAAVQLDYPKIDEFTMVDEPEVSHDFDMSSIVNLVSSFRDKAKNICDSNAIVMFKDKKPQTYEEKLISHTGRSLVILSTHQPFIEIDPYPEGRIITKRILARYEESLGTSPSIMDANISLIREEKKRKNIAAEIYSPILYQEYVVGYVFVVNKSTKPKPFDISVFDFVYEFSRALAYSLKTNGYFEAATPAADKLTADIIDVSASGVFFALDEKTFPEAMLLQSDIPLYLTIEDRQINTTSRIIRRFKGEGAYYYAAQFIKIDDKDFKYLYQHLYGKPYKEDEDNTWEGGAPPPKLDLFS